MNNFFLCFKKHISSTCSNPEYYHIEICDRSKDKSSPLINQDKSRLVAVWICCLEHQFYDVRCKSMWNSWPAALLAEQCRVLIWRCPQRDSLEDTVWLESEGQHCCYQKRGPGGEWQVFSLIQVWGLLFCFNPDREGKGGSYVRTVKNREVGIRQLLCTKIQVHRTHLQSINMEFPHGGEIQE